MALQKLQFRPGVNREGTDYSNEGGWYDCDKIRFRSGFPEKIGGWTQLSSSQFLGTCRSLWSWVDLSGNNYLGLGTNQKYYIELGGVYNDVTPYIQSDVVVGPFTTVNNSATVTVTDISYTPNTGDYIVFANATAVANVTINGEYAVNSVINSTSYTIVASNVANANATGGGTVTINYEYPAGGDIYTTGNGWGAGPWGRGTWGSAYTSGVGIQLRLWSNDNFGSDLVIAPRGGPIYYLADSSGTGTRAQSLSSLANASAYAGQYVPVATNQVVSSSIQKFVIAMGSNSYVSGDPATPFNPMLVRWSDQLNALQWVPQITNQSGEFALTNGSFIMGARSTRQEILIWTDSALYSMQYLGAPYVWGFQILMDNISVMSPNSMVTVNNVTYWMGREKFYMYSGRVETLPCSLRQYIFEDLDKDQAFQVFCGSNEGYNEVWWFYVSNSSADNTIDKYVIYNYLDRVWYYGNLKRTAWLDSGIRPYPMAADYNNRILYHESSVDDNALSIAAPINAYIQSSDFDIGDGHNFGFVWRILPDVNFNGSNVNNPVVTMTIKPRQNSGTAYGTSDNPAVVSADNYGVSSLYNIQEFTGQVYTRLRGRQMAFRIESTGLGTAWQLGSPRIDIRPDGRR
jgi:hypothetical protein